MTKDIFGKEIVMPQMAERRNGYAPKNGAANRGFNKPYPKSPDRTSSPSQSPNAAKPSADKPEPEILFQKYFKSVGPRTYAAQLKRAANKNQFLVLTEGKRDEKTGEVRKTKLFVWSEDFVEFFRMLHETAKYIRENPLPDEIRQKREKYWAKQAAQKPAGPPATLKPKLEKR